MIGRSVATVAEVCFAAQWAIALHQLGTMTGADTTLNAAWVIVPLILIAECFSWYAVMTKKYCGNAIENSIWALAFLIVAIGLCRLLPEFHGAVRVTLVVAIIGIAGYLAFLATIDVPTYLARWRAEVANGSRPLSPLEGLRDASFRWVVTHDIAKWKHEIPWMSLYFSAFPVRRKLDPGDPVNVDPATLSDAERRRRGVARMPESLGQALDALEKDEMLMEALGPLRRTAFLAVKRSEVASFGARDAAFECLQHALRF
jgi:hypothetical protein